MRLGIQVGASLVRGGLMSLGEAIAVLYLSPFRGIEVNQAYLTAFGGVEEFGRRLSRFDIELAGVYWSAKFHLREEHDFIIREFRVIKDRLSKLNSRNIIIGPPSRFRLFEGNRERYVEAMAEVLNRIIEEAGDVRLGVHNHWGTIIQNEDEINLLMKLTDPRLQLYPDIGHLSVTGIDVYGFLGKWSGRIGYIHLKDDSEPLKPAGDWGEVAGRFKVPGKGRLDIARILNILKSNGFNGWVTVEYEDPGSDPLSDLRFFIKYYNENLRGFFED
ncbi:sugar phosphate isomerase/epimerase family protein [Caldivirga maquilingensis]|uniref:sugar phosphate isomerase/epimerase family protein n=1 Tax=Caldivirga maquilingensis TaxID=76887 RepID=UPI00064E30A6|nr:TIM barrel protein [Caldivirga maquilingensis]